MTLRGTWAGLDAEAFSTAAFAGHIGVAKAKCLIEPFLDEVDLGPIDKSEAVLVHHDLDAMVLEDNVDIVYLISIVDDVGEAVTAGLLDAQTQSNATASGVEMGPDPFGSGFCQ